MRLTPSSAARLVLLPFLAAPLSAQIGSVWYEEETPASPSQLPGLQPGQGLGTSIAHLYSYGAPQGRRALALGVPGDDELGPDRGAVWVALTGFGLAASKLSGQAGSFDGVLHDGDRFGAAVIEGPTISASYSTELFLGAPGDDASASDAGAVWWSYTDWTFQPIRTEGSVKITAGQSGFAGPLAAGDGFGSALTFLPLPGGSSQDLVVGAPGDDDGGADRGAVWILTLDFAQQRVASAVKISALSGGFAGVLEDGDRFGSAVCWVEDLDGDGVHELAVGAPGDDGSGFDRGAVWVLLLDGALQVKETRESSSVSGALAGLLSDGDAVGTSLQGLIGKTSASEIGDKLVAGAPGDDDGGPDRGAVWSLYLLPDGTSTMARKVSSTHGGFAGPLEDLDGFGAGLEQRRYETPQNDDFLLAGSPGDDSGGMDTGSFWEIGIELTRPQADFHGTPLVGTPPLSVAFQSFEAGYVTSREWDFGDGAISHEQNPVHVYTALGTYDVSLTVSSIDGTDTETKLGYVVVSMGGFATPYACTSNYNLLHENGELGLGDTPTLVLYDFEGWFPLGSLTFLGLSVAPDPGFPCGSPAPAFTMSSSPAELLLDFGPGALLYPTLIGTPTFQHGIFPAGLVTVAIPPHPWLEGLRVYAQGLIFDTTPGASQRFGLTSGLEIVIGP